MIPVLHEERDMLREALGEERASREEDLHNKDAEISTLQAKVNKWSIRQTRRWYIILAPGHFFSELVLRECS